MVKILNPFSGQSSVATMFKGLGDVLGGGKNAPSVEALKWKREQQYRDEAIAAATDLAWQQANPEAYARLQFESGMTPDWYSTAGATTSALRDPRYADDPTSAYLIGGGQGAASPWNLNANRAQDQSQFDANLASDQAAEAARLAETIRNNDIQSTDRRYGVDQGVGQSMFEFLNKPMPALDEAGNPVFGEQGDLAAGGYSPILSATEFEGTERAKVIDDPSAVTDDQMLLMGVDRGENAPPEQTFQEYYNLAISQGYPPEQAKTYAMTQASRKSGMTLTTGPDGTTLDFGNIGLPGKASPSTEAQLEQMEVGFNEFQSLIQTTLPFVRDPANFGVTGNVQYLAQQVGQVLKNTGIMLGSDVEQEVMSTFAGGAEFLNNTDPSLRALQSLRVLLAYAAAKANGSVGRDLSDPEIQMNMQTIGDPTGWLTSQDSFLAALGTVDYTIKAKRNARLPVNLRTPLPDSLTYVKQFIAAAKAGVPVDGGVTPGAPTKDAPAAPIRKQFMGPNGPQWFRLVDGQWQAE